MTTVRLNEIFHSIQGEGSRAGLPCVFVRLHGCGLRCFWCDTPYALDHKNGGEVLPLDEVIARVESFGCNFVELTGGEPLEQEGAFELMTELCDRGHTVAVETGGHVDISRVDSRVIVILDLKCPASGMTKKNRLANLEYLKPTDEVKFVIADRADYEWACDLMKTERIGTRCGEVLFSPVFGSIEAADLARWILDDRLRVRMQLQLHKFIWHPDTRGV
ncbi:MAG: 7-carboxy-7-deazaguanine synthase QueE [Bacteroidia bacterium]|nr:7-carboxy-7-deazaguanine synthase QueE [Bacteroidia bacterium]